MGPKNTSVRRPLTTRGKAWPRKLAGALQRGGVSPNAVSIASTAFATIAGVALLLGTRQDAPILMAACFVTSAVAMQLRLVCNLIDGLIAVEGGLKSPTGELFNDIPDRVSDAIILVCAGYGVEPLPWAVELGWLAAVLAIMTAYVRVLGVSCGTAAFFSGPMAKQHRMALMTMALVVSALLAFYGEAKWPLYGALIIICVGSVITIARRLSLISRELNSSES